MEISQPGSVLQLLGAGGFGVLIGWYVYFINRYRKADVRLSDLVTLVGVLGGASIMALFPARTDLFGAYGIGLTIGFFGYFFTLLIMVRRSKNFDVDWFLDGRRRKTNSNEYIIPLETAETVTAMEPQARSSRLPPINE